MVSGGWCPEEGEVLRKAEETTRAKREEGRQSGAYLGWGGG